jgi:hypothetical protein
MFLMLTYDESGGFCDNYWACDGNRDAFLKERAEGIHDDWPPPTCNHRVEARNREEAELHDKRWFK